MEKHWKTKLIHSDAKVPDGFRSLNIPVYRGSTVLFSHAATLTDAWDQYDVGYTYGLYGTPTTLELAARDLRAGEWIPNNHHSGRAGCNLPDPPCIASRRRSRASPREYLRP